MDIIKRAAQELKDRVNKTSQIEKLLQEATSKENWQAHPKTLNTIADYTSSSEEWQIISKYLWEKLYKSDKSWIVTFKTLVLIEHLLKNGSPRCIMEFKDELYKIKKLTDFKFIENGEDKGASVRQRSKNIVDLLTDEDKLDHERQTAKELRDKMSNASGNTGPYGGMGSQGSSGGGSLGGAKYAGYSSDSYKDQKFSGYSSRDAPISSYKSGDAYDTSEFKGLDKYRKKEDKEESTSKISKTQGNASSSTKLEEEKKKPFQTPVAPLPKPGEAPKTIGQIKIQAPGQSGQQSAPTAAQQTQLIDFDDAPVPQQKAKQNQEDDWDWSNAPTNNNPTQQKPVTQQPVQQATNLYQQQQQQQQQNQFNLYQQQHHQQQVFQPPQQQVYQPQPPVYQQPPVQQAQSNDFDLFQSAPTTQNNNNNNNFSLQYQNNSNKQEPDLFGDFQGTQNQPEEPKIYTKDEFDLINLGDMKKEAEKKQQEKQAKNQQANEFGFSTLNTQLDSFSIGGGPGNLNNLYNMPPAPPQQSNYSALNNMNSGWGANQGYGMQGGYGQPPQGMGYGVPPQGMGMGQGQGQGQGYGVPPQGMGMGYGQPNPQFGYGGGMPGYNNNANNFRM